MATKTKSATKSSPTKAKKPSPSTTKTPLHTGPKEVFLLLMNMAMLYIGVISLIMLAFAYIDLKLPDLLANNYYYPEGNLDKIRLSSAMLVVSFPLLLLFSWLNQRELRKMPQKHELKFGKWLVYITLFVASLTIIIDLIQLVHRFYSGELTLPFVLKVLSVLILAGAVLGYYIWEVQSKPQESSVPVTVAWLSSALVVGMLVLGFVLAGSPATQRQVRIDQQRVDQLSNLQYEIINYWQLKRILPENLEALNNQLTGFTVPTDPETQQPYHYSVTGSLSFSLCAVFSQPSLAFGQSESSYYDPYGRKGDNWNHEAGEVCFERMIDPQLYPKAENTVPTVPVAF